MPDDSEETPTADRLRELLVGKSITSATVVDEKPEPYTQGPTGVLTLSDGTVLKVWGNDGGCACDAGCYPLTMLDAPDGIITNVEVDAKPDEDYTCPECKAEGRNWDYDCTHRGWYRVYVVAEDKRHPLASFEGSDGNGYYGTGWWMRVEGDQP